ncbi:hypothetical protein ACTXT7_002419 [Hymenolepis weldensis]
MQKLLATVLVIPIENGIFKNSSPDLRKFTKKRQKNYKRNFFFPVSKIQEERLSLGFLDDIASRDCESEDHKDQSLEIVSRWSTDT